MAAGDILMRTIQQETNKLYEFETRMQSDNAEKEKTLESLKKHTEVVGNQFSQSRQSESSKDEATGGKEDFSYLCARVLKILIIILKKSALHGQSSLNKSIGQVLFF